MNYFAYEKKINIKQLRKMSGGKTLNICLDLINAGLKILKSSIISERPRLSPAALKREVAKVLWPE